MLEEALETFQDKGQPWSRGTITTFVFEPLHGSRYCLLDNLFYYKT